MTWEESVKTVSEWYATNVNTYQGGIGGLQWRDCSLLGVKIQDDCGGLVSACLYYVGVIKEKNGHTEYAGPAQLTSGDYDTVLQENGFTKLNFTNFNDLQPLDIIYGSGHTEIYAGKVDGKHKAYSWGNIHNTAKGGLPCPAFVKYGYTNVWRLNGVGNFTATGNATPTMGAVSGGMIQSNPPNAPRPIMASRGKNTIYNLSSGINRKSNALTLEQNRREKFKKLVDDFSDTAPELGRDVIVSSEMFGSEILKGNQDSKTFLKKR